MAIHEIGISVFVKDISIGCLTDWQTFVFLANIGPSYDE